MRLRAAAALLIGLAAAIAKAADASGAAPEAPAPRLLFVGDVLLSRQVKEEIEQRHLDPWRDLAPLFRSAAWVGGNLEGAVGDPAACDPALAGGETCFAVPVALLGRLAKAGFRALAVENNHRADLGEAGRATTRATLSAEGLLPLDLPDSPEFVRLGDAIVAVVSLTLVPDIAGHADRVPSVEIARKLRLARALAPLTIVSVHWGRELIEVPDASQRDAARWLVAHGADLIVGHHPHVVQPAECVDGRPVFFSLGNHLFDQKYPETRTGRIADCSIAGQVLRCGALATEAVPRSTRPRLAGAEPEVLNVLAGCAAPLHPVLEVSGFRLTARPTPVGTPGGGVVIAARGPTSFGTRPGPLLSAERFRPSGGDGGDELLLALESHFSPLDQRVAPRTYVYAVTPRGLVARFRGSALAWPLVDAVTLPSGHLCALHETGSFVSTAPASAATRTAIYRWNGFGFAGIDGDDGERAACSAAFE